MSHVRTYILLTIYFELISQIPKQCGEEGRGMRRLTTITVIINKLTNR